jgi:uncharacterized protein with FMN-binding domain
LKKSAGTRLIPACVALLVALGGCAFQEKIDNLVVDDIAPALVKDGTYRGVERILPVTASVRVTVSGGRITDIALRSHIHGPDHGAEAILPRVIEAQSLRVDAVAGATYSSRVVRKAIERALRKGL